MKIKANNIDIEIEDTGIVGDKRPTVLLIMGLATQLTGWPESMVQALDTAGFRVVRLDNRDIGLSQSFDHLRTPNLIWATIKQRLGFKQRAAYSLEDMARDAVGVLDALGISSAHIVGASMGGMIAQRVAIAAPQRVKSLTSIMSSSGGRGLPRPSGAATRAILSRPKSHAPNDVADRVVQVFQTIGSPGYPTDPIELRKRALASVARSYHPAGAARQLMAIVADTGRAAHLQSIKAPTLVLHGRADPLVPFGHGEDTARRIPGAHLVGIEGMGHDLPQGVVDQLLGHMIPFMAEPAKAFEHAAD